MIYLDFEKSVEELQEQLDKLKKISEGGKVDVAPALKELEDKIVETRKNISANLNGWQRVQLSRHPERPYTLYYISQLCSKFIELHGDRNVGDDKVMVGGIGKVDSG